MIYEYILLYGFMRIENIYIYIIHRTKLEIANSGQSGISLHVFLNKLYFIFQKKFTPLNSEIFVVIQSLSSNNTAIYITSSAPS